MEGRQDSIDFYCDVICNMVKINFDLDFINGKYEIERPLKNNQYICLQAAHPTYCMQCAYMPQIKRRIEHEILEYFNGKYKSKS